MKKTLATLLILTLLISSFPAFAKDKSVKVKIAPFYTEIYGMSVNNRYVEFPFITHNDITYFPMTYDLCSIFDLMCGFDSEKGLFITREYTSYDPIVPNYFGGDALNYYDKLYDAVIPTYPIYLNGVYIDNEKEEYPLINFRGITYFPLTWRFAYEELNFNVEWSEEEYSFKLNSNYTESPYAYGVDGNIVKLQKQESVYDESINEYGDTRYTLAYSYYANYDFDTLAQKVYRREDTPKSINGGMPEHNDKLAYEELDATLNDKSIYIGETLLINLENEEFVLSPYTKEYKMGDNSLIFLTVQTSTAPAPYTTYNGYFFKKDSSGIKQIPWDERNNFGAIYPDNKGGFYVTTSGYRPANSSRWGNSISDIYYYTPDADEFVSMSEKYSYIFNSMNALGVGDGKLYFLGMWYNTEKERYHDRGLHPFSSINSGYYTLDIETGEITKLYPYICGETFFGPDGNLYCISNASRIPRIVNLNTGKLIPIE